MNWRTVLIVGLLLVSTITVLPGTEAQPYTGSVVMMDGTGNVQDYFEPNERIYFDGTVLDAGVPLQSQTVGVHIYGLSGIGLVFNSSYLTDSYGQFSGDDWDDAWYTHEVGDYILYINYSGNAVANTTFKIYIPVPWSADCWTTYYGDVTDIFFEDQRVEVYVRAYDQHGNPYDGGYGDVWYEITHLGSWVDSEYLSTDSSGEDMDYFYPEWEYEDQFGVYLVVVYNDAIPAQAIGFFNFTVVLPTSAVIQPQHSGQNRTVFTPGENVGYEITLYYQDLPYDSDSYAARLLLFKDGEEDPLNNDTLRTGSNGVDTENYYFWIGSSEDDRGTYEMKVYNHDWQEIGSAVFLVIELDIEMLPSKSVYAQGDKVEIIVRTTLDQAYRVAVTDSNHQALSGSSWNIPAGTNLWSREYTMPNINDGYYYVDVLMGSLLLDSHGFELKKLTIEGRLNQNAFVPGQQATLYWRAIDNHGGGPIDIDGTAELDYVNNVYNTATYALPNIAGSSGDFQFEVPKSALAGNYANIDLDGDDNAGHYDSEDVGLYIGWLDVDIWSERAYYRPGDSVLFSFFSHVDSSQSPVPDVELDAHLERSGVLVGTTWTVNTDSSGRATDLHPLPSGVTDGVYRIVVNAAFSHNSAVTVQSTYEFTVSSDPVLALILYQPKDTYAPGESVTIPYRVLEDGVEISDAEVSFEARLGQGTTSWSSAGTIALGFGSFGFITFDLPDDLEGYLLVHAMALTTEGYQAYAELEGSGWGGAAAVTKAQLILFSTKSIYLPGENITWVFNLIGDTVQAVSYRITDPDGVVLAEGVPPVLGEFYYLLPMEYARTVTATVYVTGSDKTYTASDQAPVYTGYIIEWKIKRYSYAPGDEMSINYTIIKIGQGPEAENGFFIQIMITGEFTKTVWADKQMGTLKFQLPEEITDGSHLFSVSLSGQGNDFADAQTIIIDSKAGDLAHGTILGMNASGFVVLLVALIGLVMALIGIVKWRQFKKANATPPPPPPPEETPPPVQEAVPPPVEQEPAYDYSQDQPPDAGGQTPDYAETPPDAGDQTYDYSQNPPPPPQWTGE